MLPTAFLYYFTITDPSKAKRWKRFLIVNFTLNSSFNILAFFNVEDVDWVSHLGAVFAGLIIAGCFVDLKKLKYKKQINWTFRIVLVLTIIGLSLWTTLGLSAAKKGI